MALYSLSLASTVTGSAAPSWDCKPSTNESKIMEVGVVNGAATACTYGYGRSANNPTQTSGVALLDEQGGGGVAVATCAVAWSTAPTVPTQFYRRVYLAATIGVGYIYSIPKGILMQTATASFVQWNIAASSALVSVHVVSDE